MDLAQDIGSFVARLGFADLPRPAIGAATQGFSECVGVMLAGCGEPAAETARLAGPGHLEDASAFDVSRVVPGPRRRAP